MRRCALLVSPVGDPLRRIAVVFVVRVADGAAVFIAAAETGVCVLQRHHAGLFLIFRVFESVFITAAAPRRVALPAGVTENPLCPR